MMDRICSLIHETKPALMMVLVQLVYAGVIVLYKLAADDGMSLIIIVAYRYIFATAFMVPLALIVERKTRPKLNSIVLFQAFLCGLFGGLLQQYFYLESLAFTSTTYATAMTNLSPGITFILAISFRLEKLRLRTLAGKAKVLGTLMGISGAMLLTFWKGVDINSTWSTNINLQHQSALQHTKSSNKPIFGCLLSLASCFSSAMWLIIQTKMSKQYPCQYSSTALMTLMGAIQSIIFAFCKEKDWGQWMLGWNIRLLTVAFSGIVSSGLIVTIVAWCVRIKGPFFVSVFNPLMLVVVALVGFFILDESLHLGSIVGATLIVCGLYVVLWGKGNDMEKITQPVLPSQNSGESQSIDIAMINSPIDYNKNNTNNNGDVSSKESDKKMSNI